ncbi:GNAT family N-acetyltransferase [Candidatus Solirubrobacter pratensis]|uniref:GNAT family N-acetyltransferase n=1 Tax=Candidatus Solirubrobacter pratensis TaxID=1298857 RepID=UPI00041522D5|nr:GNAT family N-acetyltransferase [Candidatus Solirubrobacter pratensis]
MSQAPESRLEDTLDEIVGQLRALIDVSGVAFEVVDIERGEIRPAASWFVTAAAARAFTPVLSRPYDPEHPGVTEAAIERGSALLIPSIAEWPGAAALKRRLEAGGAGDAWEWYVNSSFISCPVRTAAGRTLGVLVISAHPPRAPLREEHLRAVEVFARLAALALEREERSREEQRLNRAWQAVAASLDPDAVYRAIVEQAAELTGASKVLLRRFDPTTDELRSVANRGFSERVAATRVRPGEGMLGRVAQTGEPYVSREEDRDRFLQRTIEAEGIRSFVHVPVALGVRLFGVVTVAHEAPDRFGEDQLRRLSALSLGAAGAIANALDFQRERRVARALTRGFVPEPPAALTGFEVGIVYEPAGRDLGGGDLFGVWRLRRGALAVLLGDVSGKGLEVAAMSAMVRFFVEARTLDTDSPAEVISQANRLMRGRLPASGFATVFLAVLDGGRMRYCNAGHPAPRLLRAGGGEDELAGGGVPLGVEPDSRFTERELPFDPGDTLFAATDGLLEARRDRRFFSDAALPGLLGEHGRELGAQALAELAQAEAERWGSGRHDDVAVLVVRRAVGADLRREPAHAGPARELFEEYMRFVRERLGNGFAPSEAIFATEGAFEEPGAAFLVLYEDDRAVGCGGVRLLSPEIAEVKRMFVTAGARRRGHGRRLLGELEAIAAAAGARRVRLLTTGALAEALQLYRAADYREVEVFTRDGRRDAWLEKPL